ncbi:aspartate carbamoyltransferase [Candidatus Woesearchaeota archaeon]|nr:aspartate carbamoyltransferase [Candidatus Woesearchaeota archaeon]
MVTGGFKGRSIISIADFSREDIEYVLAIAKRLEGMKKKSGLLRDRIMATLFFEPSTRTRLSFESAMESLGGKVIGFADPNVSSYKKGESLYDTVRMVEQYCDVIVMRHFVEGAPRLAAESTTKPVLNAGDGANQHPSQTLLDLYTIQKTQGKLKGVKVAFVGDLKYGRTVHSLTIALSHFSPTFFFVSPPSLRIPSYYLEDLRQKKIPYKECEDVMEVMRQVDILYMTRIQQERFPDPADYEKVKNVYILKKEMLANAKVNMKILHPLPRVNEISTDVDTTPYAYYFQQAGNGIPIRQALLALVLGALK